MIKELAIRLESELEQRKLRNSSYSLRAFARDLEISPAYLSLILSRKVEVKKDKFELIVRNLFDDRKERERWVKQFNDLPNRFFFKGEIPEYKNINNATVNVTWAHYAVLELLNLKSFKSDIGWIDKRLGIGRKRLEEVLAELMQLGAISEENNRLITQEVSFTNIKGVKTSVDGKQMQKDLLQKAIKAINEVDISERDSTSITIAINKVHIGHIKERIKTFRRELACEIASLSEKECDSVYQFQFSVFPLTSNKEQ